MTDKLAAAIDFWKEHPVDAVKDWFQVTPTDYQGDILIDMFCGGKNRTAIKSAHGVGKTTLLAWAGWIWLITRQPSRVLATAPVQAQLRDVLWPEYSKWWARMPDGLKEQWRISGEHIRNVQNPGDWFAVSRTSNRPENLQGFHHKSLMIQVDEGSGVPQNVYEVIEGALSEVDLEGSEAVLILTGNPNFTAGESYNAFYKNSDLYNRFTITGDPKTVPTKECGKFYVSKRVTERYRKTMEKKYGLIGSVYDVRVRGMFPRMDESAVIPLEWAERAANVPLPSFDKVADPFTLVMDPARKGGDETVLGTFRRGHCLELKAWPVTSTEQCVDILKDKTDALEAQGYRVARIIVDEPGVGGGVIDTGKRRGLPISEYNGGVTMKVDRDPEEDQRMFANRRTRDWWNVRRTMEINGVHIPQDETLIAQLASVQYDYNEREKILVESKRKMRDRLGDDASPDRADVVVMGLAPWHSYSRNAYVLDPTEVHYGGKDRPVYDLDHDSHEQASLDLW